MSHENVEVIRRLFERLGPGGENSEALYELLDPEVIWDTSRLGFPDGNVYRGPEGFASSGAAGGELGRPGSSGLSR
jgi:hypothetical protein